MFAHLNVELLVKALVWVIVQAIVLEDVVQHVQEPATLDVQDLVVVQIVRNSVLTNVA